MDEQKTTTTTPRSWLAPAALGLAGLAMGGVLAGTLSASAADSTSPTSTATSGTLTQVRPQGDGDQSRSQRPDEKLLTGTTAAKVKAAALAKYPGATIERIESDSDGVYEAHLTTADGTRATVQVGKDFAVTGDEAGHGGGDAGVDGA